MIAHVYQVRAFEGGEAGPGIKEVVRREGGIALHSVSWSLGSAWELLARQPTRLDRSNMYVPAYVPPSAVLPVLLLLEGPGRQISVC